MSGEYGGWDKTSQLSVSRRRNMWTSIITQENNFVVSGVVGTPWAAIVILNDKIVATNLSHLGNEYLEFCGAEM